MDKFSADEIIESIAEITKHVDRDKLEASLANTINPNTCSCWIGDFHFPQVGNITVSIGYEEIANQTIPSEVLRLADDALYYVKEHGRNGVRCYGELLAEGKVKVIQAPVHDDIELF